MSLEENIIVKIKTASIGNYQAVQILENLKEKTESDLDKKNLKEAISTIKLNDKIILKALNIKFTDKMKKEILEMQKYFKK